MNMIERVARALAQRFIDRGNARLPGCAHSRWEDMPKSYTDDFYADARAAIEAMREPTEAITDALSPAPFYCFDAENAWRAGIDAALSPNTAEEK